MLEVHHPDRNFEGGAVMRALLLATLVSVGCASSQVGPYVKHVSRNGDWLVIHKCMIVLEGDELTEQQCTYEQLPLGQVPPGAPPPGAVAPPGLPPR